LIAGNSTKLRTQNSKKNNFNEKKISRHLERINNKLAAYEKDLAEADGDNKVQIEAKIKQRKVRKAGTVEKVRSLPPTPKVACSPQICGLQQDCIPLT